MYYTTQNSFADDVPVSVTMEDEPKVSRDGNGNGNGNGNGSDASDQEQQPPNHGPRLLQVTLAPLEREGAEEEIGGAAAVGNNKADGVEAAAAVVTAQPQQEQPQQEQPPQFPSTAAAVATGADGTTEDEYVLQSPSAANDDKSLELQIARDLQELTEQQRHQVYLDMRGEIFKAEPRTSTTTNAESLIPPTTIDRPIDAPVTEEELESLNTELYRLLKDPAEQQKNPLYEKLFETLSSSGSNYYANSTGFRTKLFRAEHRDVQKAAKRTADYLTLLWESFGPDLLSRPIKLSDLSPTERQLQRKGYQQLFKFRDQSKVRNSNGPDPKPPQPSEPEAPSEKSSQPQQSQKPLSDLDTGAGRRIAGSFDLCRCISTTEPAIDDETAKTRVLLYLLQVASDDEETQIQGIVFIFMLALRAVLNPLPTSCPPASMPKPESASLPRRESAESIFANDSNSDTSEAAQLNKNDEQLLAQLQFSPPEPTMKHNHTLSRVRVLSKVFRCGPVRVAAIHVCSPSRQELQQLKMDFWKSLGKHERVRTKFHNGTSMECSLSLNKVGIPTDRLPLKYDGTIKTEDHLQWIAIQEAKESAAKHKRAFDIVECPMNMDILSGRGQLVRSHPGNVSFRKDFIRARSVRYDMAANREEKNAIADEILEDISTLKRKFLKQHQGSGYWTELDKKTAKEKVMMAFREFRKSQRNQQQIRKSRSQPQLTTGPPPPQQQLRDVRPTLPLSHSLPHSPVTQPSIPQRPSEARSPPTLPLSGSSKSLHSHSHEAGAPPQPPQPQADHHAQGNVHYQLYPPPPPPTGSAGGPPGDAFHHPPPPHHIAGMPPQSIPYYLAHPPMPPHHHPLGYGHPIPPHLVPPPPYHHLYPTNLHDDPSSRGTTPPTDTAPVGDRSEGPPPMGVYPGSSSTASSPAPPQHGVPLASYQQHHPGYNLPPINPELSHHSASRPPCRQRDEVGGDPNERQYKRYRRM